MSRDTFKSFTAVDGVSFAVHPAESFGFLGPNGAGKTSTMRMIGCGVAHQSPPDSEITVRENLLMYARYFDIPREVAARRHVAPDHALHGRSGAAV